MRTSQETESQEAHSGSWCCYPPSMAAGRLPNLLIVGAPKSGTTAAAAALAAHPEVFMSPLKEPKFLTAQVIERPLAGPGDRWVESLWVRDLEAYRRLFRRAGATPVVGEASVDTLYFHDRVIPVIRDLLGEPRIVIFLRDPVARAYSAWKQLRRDGREPLGFEAALEAEPERIAAHWEFMWHYVAVGRYAAQVEAFLAAFPQVHIVWHHELRADPAAEMARLARFLGVDPGHRFRFQEVHNPSAVPRSPVARWLFSVGPLKVAVFKLLLRLGVSEHGVLAAVDRLRPSRVQPLELPAATRQRLEAELGADWRRVQRVVEEHRRRAPRQPAGV